MRSSVEAERLGGRGREEAGPRNSVGPDRRSRDIVLSAAEEGREGGGQEASGELPLNEALLEG